MSKLRNPLGSVDQKVLSIVGDGDVTAAQVRAAHQQVFGTIDGANACVVRFDRAGRLRTASGELGSRGRLAAGLPPAPRAEREPRVPKAGSDAVLEEYERLRAMPENRFKPRGALAAMAEDNLAEIRRAADRASRPAREPRDPLAKTDPRVREAVTDIGHPIYRAELRDIHETIFGPRPESAGQDQEDWDTNFERCVPRIKRAHLLMKGRAPRVDGPSEPREPRTPSDPLKKTDPRVRALVTEATIEGPIDRSGLRTIHEAVFGDRPESGDARETWDKNFERCVPRLKRAHLLLTSKRGEGPKSGPRKPARSIDEKANVKIMRDARGELSCLKRHAIAVAKVDADACPLGRSKSEGDALKASKSAAVKNLDELWTAALKSGSPMDAIKLLDDAAELVKEKFPGNRFGYETKAAGVLAAAMGAGSAEAAE
jgi:hypothetical protein